MENHLEKTKELDKFKKSGEADRNILEVDGMSITGIDWVNKVRPGGQWDYKKDGHPEMEYIGNFNYGATGTAMGFSPEVLLSAGGLTQVLTNTSSWSYSDSYFDDPLDQHYIQEGIDYYQENHGTIYNPFVYINEN